MQHDAHELIRLLIDRLEKDMKNSKVNAGLVSALYEGELANQVGLWVGSYSIWIHECFMAWSFAENIGFCLGTPNNVSWALTLKMFSVLPSVLPYFDGSRK